MQSPGKNSKGWFKVLIAVPITAILTALFLSANFALVPITEFGESAQDTLGNEVGKEISVSCSSAAEHELDLEFASADVEDGSFELVKWFASPRNWNDWFYNQTSEPPTDLVDALNDLRSEIDQYGADADDCRHALSRS